MQPPPHPKWATCRSLVSLPANYICSRYCSHVTDPKTCCLVFCVMQHGAVWCGCKERCHRLVFASALSSTQGAAGWWAEVGTVEATPLWYDAIQRSISDINLTQPTTVWMSVCCFLVCPNLPLKALFTTFMIFFFFFFFATFIIWIIIPIQFKFPMPFPCSLFFPFSMKWFYSFTVFNPASEMCNVSQRQ